LFGADDWSTLRKLIGSFFSCTVVGDPKKVTSSQKDTPFQ